jgi:acetoin:2,6-dichlorophenolindophenol oxidoreductase subunit alpha
MVVKPAVKKNKPKLRKASLPRTPRAARPRRAAALGLFTRALDIAHEEALEYWRRASCMRLLQQQLRENPLPHAQPETPGAEALIAGACAALRPEDIVAAATRLQSVCIARAETGTSLAVARTSIDAAVSISANICVSPSDEAALAVANGAGLSCRHNKRDQVAVAFFNAAAAMRGTFHEALQMAVLWQLPVIFICESARDPGQRSRGAKPSVRPGTIHTLAQNYGIEGMTCDGSILLEVRDTVLQACQNVRAGKWPVLLEAFTEVPVENEEGETTLSADPLQRYQEVLIDADVISREQAARQARDLETEFNAKFL